MIRGSGRVCLGSGGNRSRASDMDSRKPAFMSCMLRPALLESQGAVPLGSNPLRRSLVYRLARKTTLFRGIPTALKAFLEPCVGYSPAPGSHNKKKAVCHTRTYVRYSTNIRISLALNYPQRSICYSKKKQNKYIFRFGFFDSTSRYGQREWIRLAAVKKMINSALKVKSIYINIVPFERRKIGLIGWF